MMRSLPVVCLLAAGCLPAADLLLTVGGKVSIEFKAAGAAFRNSMSLVAPTNAGVAYVVVPDPDNLGATKNLPLSGCRVQPEVEASLPGTALVSASASQKGCRVQLDANRFTAQIDPFPAGTVLRFAMCAMVDDVAPACDYTWSSTQSLNNGTPPYSNDLAIDHVIVTPVTPSAGYTGRIFDLRWEDLPSFISDFDFDDLVARVTVELDSDGDGLWDDWEEFGIDTNGDGSPDVTLGTNKFQKDIFVRLDYMDCAAGSRAGDTSCTSAPNHSHALNATAKSMLEAAFLNAPVPGGCVSCLPGIRLRITPGVAVPHADRGNIPGRCSTGATYPLTAEGNFDMIKAAYFPETDYRRFTHRYGLLAHSMTNGDSTGCAELPGNDFIVTLGSILPSTPDNIMKQATTIMHEMGHTLGLQHGGHEPVNGKPNYFSVMNYNFQLSGIPQTGGLPPLLDYSRGRTLPTPLFETSLSETLGVGLPASSTLITSYVCAIAAERRAATVDAGGGINWNCDATVGGTVSGDINGDRVCIRRGGGTLVSTVVPDDFSAALGAFVFDGANRTCNSSATAPDREIRPLDHVQQNELRDFNDWENLMYAFQTSPDFDHGVHTTGTPDPELDLTTYNTLLGPEPSITVAPFVSGAAVTYTIRVRNDSTSPAENVKVSDTLPAGLTFGTCTSTSGGVCGGSGAARTVTFASLGGGQTATITLTAVLTCPTVATTIANTASLTTTSIDRIGGNNSAIGSITALPGCATAALPVSINRSVATLNRSTGRFSQTVVLTNLGPALSAAAYVFDGLPAGVTVVAANGTTSTALPAGSPYKEVGAIPSGGSITFTVEFARTATQSITYVPRVLGPGPR